MSKLQDLINVLNEEELSMAEAIKLNPTEESLFRWMMTHKYSPDADPRDALDLSDAHFRKSASTLFKKILDHLPSNEEPFPWARWLSQKKQHRLLEKELRKQVSKLIIAGHTEEACDLILLSNEFFLGADMAVDFLPYMEESRQIITEIRGEERPWEVLTMELQELFYGINLYRERPIDSREAFEAAIAEKQQEWDAIAEKGKKFSDPMLAYWLPYVQSRLFSLQEKDEAVIEACYQCLEIYNQNPGVFKRRYFINPQSNIALIHYHRSDFETAYSLIKEAHERYPEDMKTAWYLNDVYGQICIATDRLDEAEETLLKFHSLKAGEATEYFETQFGLGITLSLIDLLKDRNQDCFDKLQVCKRGLNKTNFYSLDALLRLVENAYFMLEEEYDIAIDQSKKNLKFHQYHKEHPLAKDFLYAHRLLPRLIKIHFDGGELKGDDLEGMKIWHSGDLAFAGKLLDKLVEAYRL